MSVRIVSLATILGVSVGMLGCAKVGGGGGAQGSAQTKDARIVTYIDKDGRCKTNTTPYVPDIRRSRRDKVRWRITDDHRCTAGDVTVEIRFDSNSPFEPLRCDLTDDKKIECQVRSDAAVGDVKYSVWMGGQQEDPVLQIEM